MVFVGLLNLNTPKIPEAINFGKQCCYARTAWVSYIMRAIQQHFNIKNFAQYANAKPKHLCKALRP